MTTAVTPMERGMVIRTPDGQIQVSVGMKDEQTVVDGHGHRWPVHSCSPVTNADDIPAQASCGEADKIGHVGMVPGFTVSCLCVKMWGRKALIWTPCCGKVKKKLDHMSATRCPECGWWWRLFLGAEHKIVWLGAKRPYDVPPNQ